MAYKIHKNALENIMATYKSIKYIENYYNRNTIKISTQKWRRLDKYLLTADLETDCCNCKTSFSSFAPWKTATLK